MPLSKQRDKERKQRERAKVRLERSLCPPRGRESVQPKTLTTEDVVTQSTPEIDADGNIIYEG